MLFPQILQEQQALLLEDSPAYLAALSQDNKDSLLNMSADAHRERLADSQGLSTDEMVSWTSQNAAAGNRMRYSRSELWLVLSMR